MSRCDFGYALPAKTATDRVVFWYDAYNKCLVAQVFMTMIHKTGVAAGSLLEAVAFLQEDCDGILDTMAGYTDDLAEIRSGLKTRLWEESLSYPDDVDEATHRVLVKRHAKPVAHHIDLVIIDNKTWVFTDVNIKLDTLPTDPRHHRAWRQSAYTRVVDSIIRHTGLDATEAFRIGRKVINDHVGSHPQVLIVGHTMTYDASAAESTEPQTMPSSLSLDHLSPSEVARSADLAAKLVAEALSSTPLLSDTPEYPHKTDVY